MTSVLFEAVAQSVKDPYKVNSTEDLENVFEGVNRMMKEKVDRGEEYEEDRLLDKEMTEETVGNENKVGVENKPKKYENSEDNTSNPNTNDFPEMTS